MAKCVRCGKEIAGFFNKCIMLEDPSHKEKFIYFHPSCYKGNSPVAHKKIMGSNTVNFEFKCLIRHKGHRGDNVWGWNRTGKVACINNELILEWGLMKKQVIRVLPTQIQSYEISEPTDFGVKLSKFVEDQGRRRIEGVVGFGLPKGQTSKQIIVEYVDENNDMNNFEIVTVAKNSDKLQKYFEENLNKKYGGNEKKELEKVREVVYIRCQKCKTKNEEDAKYCKKCGKKI